MPSWGVGHSPQLNTPSDLLWMHYRLGRLWNRSLGGKVDGVFCWTLILEGWHKNRPMRLINDNHLAKEHSSYFARRSFPKPQEVYRAGSKWYRVFWRKALIPLIEQHVGRRGERILLVSDGYPLCDLSTRYPCTPLNHRQEINNVWLIVQVSLGLGPEKSLEGGNKA